VFFIVKMPTFKVNVKWGKEKFTDVECNMEEPPVVFKAQLFALSGVAPERQKVMIKGAVIKDDEWGNVKIKEGVTLLMMGTAEALPTEPVDKPVFVEDMSEAQLATALSLPPGLTNLGNTCYMNATLQCLRSVPELKQALKGFSGQISTSGVDTSDQSITAAIRDLFDTMDTTSNSFPPLIMLQVLHMCFPRFAEKGDHGEFQQQDANECWTELVRCLQRRLTPLPSNTGAEAAAVRSSFIDQFFGGEFEVTMKCIEAEDEPQSKSKEPFLQLSCFIEKEVKYLHTGLVNRLQEHITKNSPTLGRDAQYLKTNKIKRLPAYLTIQMVRFYFKEKDSINAKILKDVKFPMSLDVYDMCTEDLQKSLLPMREKIKVEDDKAVERAQKLKAKDQGTKGVAAPKEEKKNVKREPYYFPNDPGSNNSGHYELQAVLTHKGRSSSSGHYVGWVRKTKDEWLMFDDDQVNPMTSEDVLKLSGGGDWHCAYVLLYGPRILEIDLDAEKEDAAEKAASETTKTDNKETPMETAE